MSPLLKPIGLLGGTLLVLMLGRKKEEAVAPPPETLPPVPKPPVPGPVAPPPAPTVPPGNETGFPAGAILGVITNDGVRLRAAPSETSAAVGTMARGTLVQLFEDGHRPATAAAPQGWERIRTVAGQDGFVAAQFLTAAGLPGGPRELPVDIGPAAGPAAGPIAPGAPEAIPQAPETTGTETTEGGPLNVPVTILTPEEQAAINQLGDLFQGAPPRFGFFSPSIGARAPAYGQTMFVRPRTRFAGFGADAPRLRSINYQLARAVRLARAMPAPAVLAEARAATARGDTMIAHALMAIYARKVQRRTFAPRAGMRG